MPEKTTKPDTNSDATRSVPERDSKRSRYFRHRLITPFWNRSQDRIRAFWRIIGAFVLVAIGSQLVPAVIFDGSDRPIALVGLGQNIVAVIITLLVAALWARFVDRRPFAGYGLRVDPAWLRDAGVGVAIAVICWGLALAVSLAVGWAHVSAIISPGVGAATLPFGFAFAAYVIQFLCVGIWEELLFRGIILQNAVEGFDSRWLSDRGAVMAGVAFSSFLFGIVHVDQATSLFALGYWVLIGMTLGGAYVVTDSLAIPIGLHFATDVAFNNIYGLSNVRPDVADVVATVIRPTFTGPERFVEVAGIVNTGAALLIAILTVSYVFLQYGCVDLRVPSWELTE